MLWRESPATLTGSSSAGASRRARRPAPRSTRTPSIEHGGTPASLDDPLDSVRARIHAESRDVRARQPAHRPRSVVIGVQDGPSAALRHAHDDALHLGQLVDGVDPLQAEVIGAEVRDHAHVVGGIADAAQQDSTASGLEHREIEAGLGQHAPGTAEPGPVPRLDQLAAHEDAVRVRHPDLEAGLRARRARSAGWWWSFRSCR